MSHFDNNFIPMDHQFEDVDTLPAPPASLGDCTSCHSTTLALLPPFDLGYHIAICSDCGLITTHLKDKLQLKEAGIAYNSITQIEAEVRDSSRLNYFLTICKKHVDFSKAHSLLDIGGGTGLLSHLIKEEYPHIDVHNLDPSESVIDFGASHFTNITHHKCAFEQFEHDAQPFDIILHTGGLYRHSDLCSVLQKIRGMLNTDGIFVAPIVLTLDSPQPAKTGLLEKHEHIFRHGDIKTVASIKQYEELLSQHFDLIITEEHVPPRYSMMKVAPFFFARKGGRKRRRSNFHDDNINKYFNLIRSQHRTTLAHQIQSRFQSVAILGIGSEAEAVYDAAVGCKMKTHAFYHPLAHRHKDYSHQEQRPRHIDYTPILENSCIIIADSRNEDRYVKLIDKIYPELNNCTIFKAHFIYSDTKATFYRYQGKAYPQSALSFSEMVSWGPKEHATLYRTAAGLNRIFNKYSNLKKVLSLGFLR